MWALSEGCSAHTAFSAVRPKAGVNMANGRTETCSMRWSQSSYKWTLVCTAVRKRCDLEPTQLTGPSELSQVWAKSAPVVLWAVAWCPTFAFTKHMTGETGSCGQTWTLYCCLSLYISWLLPCSNTGSFGNMTPWGSRPIFLLSAQTDSDQWLPERFHIVLHLDQRNQNKV